MTNEYLDEVEKTNKHMLWCVRMLRKGRKLRVERWATGSHIKLNKEGKLVFMSGNSSASGESRAGLSASNTYVLLPRTNPHKEGTWKWARWEVKHNNAKQLSRRVYSPGDRIGWSNFTHGVFSVNQILAKDWYVVSTRDS